MDFDKIMLALAALAEQVLPFDAEGLNHPEMAPQNLYKGQMPYRSATSMAGEEIHPMAPIAACRHEIWVG